MVRPIVLLAWMLAAAALSQQQCKDTGCPKGFAPKHHRLLDFGYCKHPLFIQDAKKKCPKTCFTCYPNRAVSYCEDYLDIASKNSALRELVGMSCEEGKARGLCAKSNLGAGAKQRLFLAACTRTCSDQRKFCQDYVGLGFAGSSGELFEAGIKPRTCVDIDQCLPDFVGPICTDPYNFERMKQYCPKQCFNCDFSNAAATCEDSPTEQVQRQVGFTCAKGKEDGNCDLTDDLASDNKRQLFLESCPKTCGYCPITPPGDHRCHS